MKPIYKCRVCGKYVEEAVHCNTPAELLMTGAQRLRLSKLMSALLRHIPWEAGLKLDEHGWVGVSELVKGIREKWRNRELYQWVREEHVIAIAMLDPKGRFQLSPDRTRIRAAYGHSVRVELDYEPLPHSNVPSKLLHGTTRDKLKSILREGLKPMKRLMVHLTTSLEDAIETAKRHGSEVVVLEIDRDCLARYRIPVYKAGKRVYLTPYVPPQCVKVLI